MFGLLPDGSYVLHDTRMILHENTLEDPLIDGGGSTVLRSTIRAQRNGMITARHEIGPGIYSDTFYVYSDRNIALVSLSNQRVSWEHSGLNLLLRLE